MRFLTKDTATDQRLNEILAKAENEAALSTKELAFLLGLKERSRKEFLFKTARELRRKYFGDKIFLYGFIYTSTFCRNDCCFCYYRKSNKRGRRYRKTDPEIISTAVKLAKTGVHLIDLTMGEDPLLFKNGDVEGHRLCELVKSVAKRTGLPVMVSPGLISESLLHRLKASGATWYACYQETHTRRLFNRLRSGQDFNNRMKIKAKAHKQGFLVEEGILCGIGEEISDIVRSIEAMKTLDADQVRVMKFIPQKGTPMETRPSPDPWMDMIIIGILRLVFPRRLIPATLDVDGIANLKNRLDAGANVVTSIVPPGQGLSGVARHSLNIEDGNRSSNVVTRILNQRGLAPASSDAYLRWVALREQSIASPDSISDHRR
jgi:methylornithine synthase